MALAKQMLAWCAHGKKRDNIGVRFLLGDIALLQGDHKAALKEYLAGAPNSPVDDPKAWYQAALIAFRDGDYMAACTYLRRGIAANSSGAAASIAARPKPAPTLGGTDRHRGLP
ncbi:MAG: tetratricopeptide repeat protein [Limnohabitans sp.]